MAVLTVLKWIAIVLGIVIGGVLALALLLIALLLFVPFRYEAEFEHASMGESVLYGFRVSWLLRAVSFRKKLNEEQMVLRILGIPVKRMGGEKSKETEDSTDGEEEKADPEADNKGKESNINSPAELEIENANSEGASEGKQVKTDKNKDKSSETEEAAKVEKAAKTEENKSKRRSTRVERRKKKKANDEPEMPYEWLEKRYLRLKEKIKSKISGIREKVRLVFRRISDIIDFVRDDASIHTIKLLTRELVNLIKYIGPQKIRGEFTFGTGDPSSTGLLLGGISLCPAVYEKGVTVTPDFEEKLIVGEGALSGRIRLIYLVRLVIRLLMDFDVRLTYKRYKKLSK